MTLPACIFSHKHVTFQLFTQISIVVQSCPILCDPMDRTHQASLTLTISWGFPKFMSIASVMPSSHLSLWRPLLLLPSVFPSIRDFSNESAVHIRWPKYSFSISPPNEYLGLISLKIDWFDLLVVRGTLRASKHTKNRMLLKAVWKGVGLRRK